MSVGYKPTPIVEPGYNFDIAGQDIPVPEQIQGIVKKADEITKELVGPVIPVNNDTEVAGKKVYTIGDAGKVANIKAAIWSAWDVAMRV